MTFPLASRYLMAALYVLAGLNHFRVPEIYIKIIPPYLPAPALLNFLAGVAEVVLGLLLFPTVTAPLAAWGVIALLIAVFPANLYMYTSGKFSIPDWLLLARLPLQLALMAWAWAYT